MTLKKKIIYSSLGVLSIVLAYGLNYVIRFMHIGSAYDAKMVCSCMFVAGRDLQNIKDEELYAIPFADIQVDKQEQSVTANIHGFGEAKAIYRKGLGCTLVNDISVEELKKQPNYKILDDTTHESLSLIKTLPTGVDELTLNKVVANAFADKTLRTRAVIILHNGKLITEKYAENIKPETPLIGWSMTKSVTNAMIGLLVKDGKIDIQKPAPIEEWKDDERNKITVNALLRMSSGLDFEENYAEPSDATAMLFSAKGAGAFAIKSKAKAKPLETWYYSSGTTNILQEIIRRQFSNHIDYLAFPHLRLFRKIGMKSAILEPDASGTYVGSSFMWATAKDWAKFGQLYLQDGIWNGERILPEGWMKYSTSETPHSDGKYAAQFWIGHNDKTFPQDAFMALGFEGQSVTVVPSKQLVIVRLGCTANESRFDRVQFVKNVVATVK